MSPEKLLRLATQAILKKEPYLYLYITGHKKGKTCYIAKGLTAKVIEYIPYRNRTRIAVKPRQAKTWVSLYRLELVEE